MIITIDVGNTNITVGVFNCLLYTSDAADE